MRVPFFFPFDYVHGSVCRHQCQLLYLYGSQVDQFISLADELEESISDIVVEGRANDNGSNAFTVKAGSSDNAPVIHSQSASDSLDSKAIVEKIRTLVNSLDV
jgi:hypothetical protein